jgi:hypothetical protein
MRSGAATLASVLGAGVVLAGCSLLLTYPGVSGSQVAADTSSDAGVVEASAEAEAGYPPNSWCAAQDPSLFLCDDFDEDPLGQRWAAKTFPFPGVAGFSNIASSPPRSFSLDFPAITTMQCSTCTQEVLSTTTGSATQVTFAFDIQVLAYRIEQDGGGDGSFYVGGFTQGSGEPRSAVWLAVATSYIQVDEQLFYGLDAGGTEIYNPTQLFEPIAAGAFTRIVLEANFQPGAPTVTLRVGAAGDAGTAVVKTIALTPGWWGAAPTTLFLGATWADVGPPFNVLYDNATIAAR